jgi:hypothetical protein
VLKKSEEVDLFLCDKQEDQPIVENEAVSIISNGCQRKDMSTLSEIGESNVGKRPASPQRTSSKRHLQECTSEYISVRKMTIFLYIRKKNQSKSNIRPDLLSSSTVNEKLYFFFSFSDCRLPTTNSPNLCQLCCELPMCTRCRKRLAPITLQ